MGRYWVIFAFLAASCSEEAERDEPQLVATEALLERVSRMDSALRSSPEIQSMADARERLEKTKLPEVRFDALPFRDALEWLQQASVRHATDGKGMTFILELGEGSTPEEPAVSDQMPITLNLRDVSLDEALRAVADQAGAKIVIEPFAIKWVPAWTPDRVYVTGIFQVSPALRDMLMSVPTTIDDPFADPSADKAVDPSAKRVLESAGIVFPGEANAILDAEGGRLIVRNTQEQMELIDAFIKANSPPIRSND